MASRYAILGPLELSRGGRQVPVGGPRQVSLLAYLLVNANRAVSSDEILEAVWAGGQPAGAKKRLQVAVARLRRTLGEAGEDGQESAPLRSVLGGYLLDVQPCELDAHVFERGVEDAHRAQLDGDPRRASDLCVQALALWRGPALAQVAYEDFATDEVRRLEELRLRAIETRVAADLRVGRHALVIGELEALAAAYPLRELLTVQLMQALYACGRQTEALEAFERTRMQLATDFGLEPGPALKDLQAAVLAHSIPPTEASLETIATETTHAPDARGRDTMRGGQEMAFAASAGDTFGRDAEIAGLIAHLRTGSDRLITLHGPGGVGKTRLAGAVSRALADDYPDGVWFVALASVQRADEVPAAAARAVGVHPLGDETPFQALVRSLRPRRALLVLDNFEHVSSAADLVAELLASASLLTVLVTSRAPLRLSMERKHRVQSLALPDAMRLFAARAAGQDPAFRITEDTAPAVEEICRRLDALPLAIELAAARTELMSVQELASRLRRTLADLGPAPRDAPIRHRTLRDAIDWSVQLLDAPERRCFATFAVFVGGATIEAAERVLTVDVTILQSLVAHSLLVRARSSDHVRLEMLETVRADALERLADDESREEVCERHCRYYLAFAQRHGSRPALFGTHRRHHLELMDADHGNLLSAADWATGTGRAELALALVASAGDYWYQRAVYARALQLIEDALRLPGAEAHPALRVDALVTEAMFLWPTGRRGEQEDVLHAATVAARALDDPRLLARCLNSASAVAANAGDAARSSALAEDAAHWARVAKDPWEAAVAQFRRFVASPTTGDLRQRVAQTSTALRTVGNIFDLAALLSSSIYAALLDGDVAQAKHFRVEALALAGALDSPYMTMLISGNSGLAALFAGEVAVARQAFRRELELCRELVVYPVAYEGLLGLAAVAACDGQPQRVARLLGAAEAYLEDVPQDAVQMRLRSTFFEPARSRCASAAWGLAYREGADLDFEGAIAYALETSDFTP